MTGKQAISFRKWNQLITHNSPILSKLFLAPWCWHVHFIPIIIPSDKVNSSSVILICTHFPEPLIPAVTFSKTIYPKGWHFRLKVNSKLLTSGRYNPNFHLVYSQCKYTVYLRELGLCWNWNPLLFMKSVASANITTFVSTKILEDTICLLFYLSHYLNYCPFLCTIFPSVRNILNQQLHLETC